MWRERMKQNRPAGPYRNRYRVLRIDKLIRNLNLCAGTMREKLVIVATRNLKTSIFEGRIGNCQPNGDKFRTVRLL